MVQQGNQNQNVNRKSVVVAAAKAVFGEVGYQKASMREIARRADMTQAAIYYHFRNKEDVLMFLILDFTDELIARLTAIVDLPGKTKSKLGRIIYDQVGLVGIRRTELKILIEDKVHLGEKNLGIIRQKEKVILGIYKDCLEQMKLEGDLNDIDTTTAAFSILGSINWVYHWYRDDGSVSFEEVQQSILTFVLSGCCNSAEFAAELKEAV